LDPDEPEPVPVEIAPTPQPASNGGCGVQVAIAIRMLRLRTGMSQRQLALRMQVPRTYVSKIENEKATPTLSSLERLARALEVTVPDLIGGGQSHQQELRELMADDFIAELAPYLPKLNGMQWQSVLTQVRELTTRTPHSA